MASLVTPVLQRTGQAIVEDISSLARNAAAGKIQRVFRGMMGRRAARKRRLATVRGSNKRFKRGARTTRGTINRATTRITSRQPALIFPTVIGDTGLACNNLKVYDLTSGPAVFNRDLPSARQRAFIDITAISFRWQLNAETDNNGPLVFHIAVVRPEEDDWDPDTSAFFTDPRSGANSYNAIPFTDSSIELGERNMLSISKTAMHVYKHKKYVVQPYFVMNTSSSPQNFKSAASRYVKMYVPIKRRFNFDDLTKTIPNERLYVLWWTCPLRPLDEDPANLTCTMQGNIRIYMKGST